MQMSRWSCRAYGTIWRLVTALFQHSLRPKSDPFALLSDTGVFLGNTHYTDGTSRTGFEIAIICALPLEADAMGALFDSFYGDQEFGKRNGNGNAYTTGVIGVTTWSWHTCLVWENRARPSLLPDLKLAFQESSLVY
jgi:hypothetical protein